MSQSRDKCPKWIGLAGTHLVEKFSDNAGLATFMCCLEPKQNVTPRDPKMYPHTKFGIPT